MSAASTDRAKLRRRPRTSQGTGPPRAAFNPAGWISWIVGFLVGAVDFIPGMAGAVACPPFAAFVVGFALYYILAKLGLESETLEMPAGEEEPAQA